MVVWFIHCKVKQYMLQILERFLFLANHSPSFVKTLCMEVKKNHKIFCKIFVIVLDLQCCMAQFPILCKLNHYVGNGCNLATVHIEVNLGTTTKKLLFPLWNTGLCSFYGMGTTI